VIARIRGRFRGLLPRLWGSQRLWGALGLLIIVLIALARSRDMGILQQSMVVVLGLAAGTAIVGLAAVGQPPFITCFEWCPRPYKL
jgi:hypothetical protein